MNKHLDLIKQGQAVWSDWKMEYPDESVDLTNCDLSNLDLSDFDLSKSILYGADLTSTILNNSNLSECDLRGATFIETQIIDTDMESVNLYDTHFYRCSAMQCSFKKANMCAVGIRESNFEGADFDSADLRYSRFHNSNFNESNFSNALLTNAELNNSNFKNSKFICSVLVKTNIYNIDLSGSRIYGISAWDLDIINAKQKDLVITPIVDPVITVDNLEVAQFLYLLINNEKIRDVINTITSKVVLILGRFIPHRKKILDLIRDELRKINYLPVMFDFEKPITRNYRETITTLARMSKFIIADLTDAKVVLQELEAIVPTVKVPVKPIIDKSTKIVSVIESDFNMYPWFLEVHKYKDSKSLIYTINDKIIKPCERSLKKLLKK